MYVPDIREALDFYTDKLGFKVVTGESDADFAYATAALPDAAGGGCAIFPSPFKGGGQGGGAPPVP